MVCTLAETGEVLRVIHRPGNRPSHEGAADAADQLMRRLIYRLLTWNPQWHVFFRLAQILNC